MNFLSYRKDRMANFYIRTVLESIIPYLSEKSNEFTEYDLSISLIKNKYVWHVGTRNFEICKEIAEFLNKKFDIEITECKREHKYKYEELYLRSEEDELIFCHYENSYSLTPFLSIKLVEVEDNILAALIHFSSDSTSMDSGVID